MIPMAVLIGVTVVTEDILSAVILTLFLCLILYVPRKRLTFTKWGELLISGYCEMMPTLAILVGAFTVARCCSDMQLPEYVISLVRPYVTPATYRLLKQAAGLTRYMDVSGDGRTVDRNVSCLDGVQIREVPAELMKSAYVFTEGWAPAENAKQINLILVDPEAVAAPVKYEVAMMSEPTAQSKGKYLYYERYYYGAFRLDNRAGGIIVNAAAN